MSLPDKCPLCCAHVLVEWDGKQRKSERSATFECQTSIYAGQAPRQTQSRWCEVRERQYLAARVAELEERCKRLEEAGDILGAAADAADIDIGQHLQVANYNLHGLLNTGDRVNPPNPPHTIHQNGIDESVMVRKKVRQARQAWKQAKEAKP